MLSTAAIVKSPLHIFGEQTPPVNWLHSYPLAQVRSLLDSCNGVGSCSVLEALSGHNFYGEKLCSYGVTPKIGGIPCPWFLCLWYEKHKCSFLSDSMHVSSILHAK